ncbi:hypothetical protein RCL1_007637 [Eukaryota sp. TZLM3-RCL]
MSSVMFNRNTLGRNLSLSEDQMTVTCSHIQGHYRNNFVSVDFGSSSRFSFRLIKKTLGGSNLTFVGYCCLSPQSVSDGLCFDDMYVYKRVRGVNCESLGLQFPIGSKVFVQIKAKTVHFSFESDTNSSLSCEIEIPSDKIFGFNICRPGVSWSLS